MGSRHALVLGGSGFVGRAVCREAIKRGWAVSSLSRQGAPRTGAQDDPALSKVTWISGDALDRGTYENALRGDIDTVIHSIGTLLEPPKTLSPLGLLYAQFKRYKGAASTAAMTKAERSRLSYQAVNRDTALIAAEEAAKSHSVKAFAFVSATSISPLSDIYLAEYLRTKREVEVALLKSYSAIFNNVVIAQPGVMYGDDLPSTITISKVINMLSSMAPGTFAQALRVDSVAAAVIDALEHPARPSENKVILKIADMMAASPAPQTQS